MRIEAGVRWHSDGRLDLRFHLTADLRHVRIPPAVISCRRDRLWEATCFEAFVAAPSGRGYLEFNFSPSSAWAAFAFADYRRRRSGRIPCAPNVRVRRASGRVELVATVFLHAWRVPPPHVIHVGLSAVLEHSSGHRDHWALRHAGARPDFHDRRGFALRVAAV